MTVRRTSSNDVDEMQTEYLNAALAWGETQRRREFRSGNRFARRLESLGRLLRDHEKGRRCLENLAAHDDPYVRIWAAKDCLAFDAEFAIAVLDEIGKDTGLLGLDALTVLSEWRRGHSF